MIELKSKKEMDGAISENRFALFYLSREACGVCKSLKPKVKLVADRYKNLHQFYIDLDNDETIAGQYSIFTIPAILVFVDGKETIREARYLSMDELEDKIKRISDLL